MLLLNRYEFMKGARILCPSKTQLTVGEENFSPGV